MKQLAPGLGTKRRDETSVFSFKLVRLTRQGLIGHATKDRGAGHRA